MTTIDETITGKINYIGSWHNGREEVGFVRIGFDSPVLQRKAEYLIVKDPKWFGPNSNKLVSGISMVGVSTYEIGDILKIVGPRVFKETIIWFPPYEKVRGHFEDDKLKVRIHKRPSIDHLPMPFTDEEKKNLSPRYYNWLVGRYPMGKAWEDYNREVKKS